MRQGTSPSMLLCNHTGPAVLRDSCGLETVGSTGYSCPQFFFLLLVHMMEADRRLKAYGRHRAPMCVFLIRHRTVHVDIYMPEAGSDQEVSVRLDT